jgi:hypothetical protein
MGRCASLQMFAGCANEARFGCVIRQRPVRKSEAPAFVPLCGTSSWQANIEIPNNHAGNSKSESPKRQPILNLGHL